MDGPSLSIRIAGSRLLPRLLAALHLLALAGLPFVALPALLRVLLALACVASLLHALASLRPGRMSHLSFESGQWTLDGEPAFLDPGSSLLPWLVVLRFRTARGTRSLCVLPDSADAASLRRLRVVLRQGLSSVSAARGARSG